jgi:hypothetical protein
MDLAKLVTTSFKFEVIAMDRLTNEQFLDALTLIKEGKHIPYPLATEDREDLQVAERFIKLRNTSPMELIGTTERILSAGKLMKALRSLRPVEKRIVMYFLGGGVPLRYAAAATYRTEAHGLQSLRSGLSHMRKFLATH